MQEALDFITNLLKLVTAYSIGTWLLLIGLVLCFLSVITRRENGTNFWDIKLRETPLRWLLGLGIALVVFSQASLLTYQKSPRLVTPEESFKRLTRNARVTYVIRLIPYDSDKDRDKLSVGKITDLGPPGKEYIFVADYEELRNYRIRDAIYKTGGILSGLKNPRVTGIIFPRNNRDLYPADARGLLQVVHNIDEVHKADEGYKVFDIEKTDLDALEDQRIRSWAWDSWRNFYDAYRQKCNELLTGKYGATHYLSEIRRDWQPAGYAQLEGYDSGEINAPTFHFSTLDGTTVELRNYGARIFLIKNERIDTIDNVVLCNFSDLDHDIIPDFGGKFDTLADAKKIPEGAAQ
jgi:hypothetical protein